MDNNPPWEEYTMEGNYANKSHAHKPDKGKGSYNRQDDWTWEEEEAFREIERQQQENEIVDEEWKEAFEDYYEEE